MCPVVLKLYTDRKTFGVHTKWYESPEHARVREEKERIHNKTRDRNKPLGTAPGGYNNPRDALAFDVWSFGVIFLRI